MNEWKWEKEIWWEAKRQKDCDWGNGFEQRTCVKWFYDFICNKYGYNVLFMEIEVNGADSIIASRFLLFWTTCYRHFVIQHTSTRSLYISLSLIVDAIRRFNEAINLCARIKSIVLSENVWRWWKGIKKSNGMQIVKCVN